MSTALASRPVSNRIATNRSAVIEFARRMVTAGEVTVTSPMHRDLIEHRLAIHDPERTGYTVIFISVTDGVPETTSVNFDLDESIASRHIVHEDGLGLTLVDVVNRPTIEYRIG